jgi:hypothetical protein
MQSYSNLEPQILFWTSFPCYAALEKYAEYFCFKKCKGKQKNVCPQRRCGENPYFCIAGWWMRGNLHNLVLGWQLGRP